MTDLLAAVGLRILAPRANLLGVSDPDSLVNVDTNILPNGASVWVNSSLAEFRLRKTDNSTPPDNINIVAPISGPGRWFINSGSVGPGGGIQVQDQVGLTLPPRPIVNSGGLHPVDTGVSAVLLNGEIDVLAFASLATAGSLNPGFILRLLNTTYVLDGDITDPTTTLAFKQSTILDVAANRTLASAIEAGGGGLIVVGSGVTLTMTGPIHAPNKAQLWDVSAAGSAVVLGAGVLASVTPEMFGGDLIKADATAAGAGIPLVISGDFDQGAAPVTFSSTVDFTSARGRFVGTGAVRHSGKVIAGETQFWDCPVTLDDGVMSTINPSNFGAVPDVVIVPAFYAPAYLAADLLAPGAFIAGSISGTDNAPALMRMREATRHWKHCHVKGQSGIYGVSQPHWFYGWVGHLVVEHFTFVNLTTFVDGSGQFFADCMAITVNLPGPFSTFSYSATTVAGTTTKRGWRFASVSGGARQITLITPAWVTATSYVKNDHVTNAGKVYEATTSGTSGATAPVHTSGTASDGGVTWQYLGVAGVAGTYPFAEGVRVLLGGFGQQLSSNPPCDRYFDYLTVTAFDPATGIIKLDHELRYDYDDRWWEYTSDNISGGAPRVNAMDTPTFAMGESITLRNVRVELNPTYDGRGTGGGVLDLVNGAWYLVGYRHARLEHCQTPAYFAISIVDSFEAFNCSFGYIEIDKLIHRAEFTDCDAQYFSQAVDCVYLTARRCRLNGIPAFSPRNALFEDCEIHNVNYGQTLESKDVLPLAPFFYSKSIEFRGNCRIGTENIDASSNLHGLMQAGAQGSFLVDSVPSNTKVVIAVANDVDVYHIQAGLARDSLIRDAADPTVIGRVTNIYQDSALHLAVEAEFTKTPTAGHTFTWESLQSLKLQGIEQIAGAVPITKVISQHNVHDALWAPPPSRIYLVSDRMPWTPSGGNDIGEHILNAFHSRIRRVWCEVSQAHTGAAPASISVPNNLAGWGFAGSTFGANAAGPDGGGTTSNKFTCNAGAGIHEAQSVITNFHQWTCRFVLWLLNDPAFPWRCIQFGDAFPNSGSVRYVDLNTGALGVSTAVVSGGPSLGLAAATKLGDAVTLGVGADANWQKWQFDGTQRGTAAPHMFIAAANGDGGASFNAAGTETVAVGAGATFGPVLTDVNLVAQLSLYDPLTDTYIQSFDLTRLGARECLDSGATGGGGADIIAATDSTIYSALSIRMHTGGQMITWADYAERPQFALDIDPIRYR